jgi:hypothetical protein
MQGQGISIDLSTGQPAHREMLDNLCQALILADQFLQRVGVSTEKKTNELYTQMKRLLDQSDFCAFWFLQTIWASKPE